MSKISTFIPNVKGNGSKFCAAMMAFQINKIQPLAKIIIVDLNTKGSYFLGHFFHADEFHTFENFYIQHKMTQNAKEAVSMSKISVKENIDLLKASASIVGSRINYSPLEVVESINALGGIYDYVIISTSSELDNLSIAAISISQNIFLVLSDNIENYIHAKWKIEEISTLRKMNSHSYVLYNKYSNNLPSSEFGAMLKANDFETLALIPYSAEYIDNKNIFELFGKKSEIKKGKVRIAELRELNKRELEKIEIKERLGIKIDEKTIEKTFSEKSIKLIKKTKKDGVVECFRYIYDYVYYEEDEFDKKKKEKKIKSKESKKTQKEGLNFKFKKNPKQNEESLKSENLSIEKIAKKEKSSSNLLVTKKAGLFKKEKIVEDKSLEKIDTISLSQKLLDEISEKEKSLKNNEKSISNEFEILVEDTHEIDDEIKIED